MQADTSPFVRVALGGEPLPTTTLANFLAANAEGIDPEQAREISDTIAHGQTYHGGGGAAEAWTVTPCCAPPAATAEPRSGLPAAALVDEPLYLLHVSPLRAAVLALAPTAGAGASAVEACRYGARRRPVVLCRVGGAHFVLTAEEAEAEARSLVVNAGGATDPAAELSNHLAGNLLAAAATLRQAEAA